MCEGKELGLVQICVLITKGVTLVIKQLFLILNREYLF